MTDKRIMFMANAPWATTGYGVQGKHLVKRWQAKGYKVAYFAFYGLANGILNVDGSPIYPMGHRPWGEDILAGHMAHFGADILVTLMDVWVTDWFGRRARDGGWRWLPWLPVDQSPVPKIVVDRLEGATLALPYSRFGEAELKRAWDADRVRYVPHGVDTATFHPPTAEEKTAARARVGVPPETFLIGTVAANKGYPSRKALPEQLMAFRRFRDWVGVGKTAFYLHTLLTPATGGVDIMSICQSLDLVPGRDIFFTNQYEYTVGLPEPAMAELYQAFDILTLASMGEGFGLPLIEAQSCGVPVVTTNATSETELTMGGIATEPAQRFWTLLNSWAYVPSVAHITEAYLELYDMWKSNGTAWRDIQARARAGAEDYDWDKVMTYWDDVLEGL